MAPPPTGPLQIPLPDKLRELVPRVAGAEENLSLRLNLFVPWAMATGAQGLSISLRGKERAQALDSLMPPGGRGRSPSAEAALARRRLQLPQALHLCYDCAGPLLVDHSQGSPAELGLGLHPLYGCPRIPGSALRGLLRAWLELNGGQELADRWLGLPPQANDKGGRAGGLLLHEALPVGGRFRLAADVVNPHFRGWHAGQDELPQEWAPPIPSSFLVVVETRFELCLEAGPGMRPSELTEVQEQLREALYWLGVGARSAAGYGRLVPAPGPPSTPERAPRRPWRAR